MINKRMNINYLNVSFFYIRILYTTRGVVLDLVPDASTTTFVNSIKVISRRGCPRIMLSDNGTAFTPELTQHFAATRNTKWQFSLKTGSHLTS